ncbi:MAG: FG-GAP-like repeat-containing protein [Flavobacteriales bacterium]|nr:FG-GAP-like repeat-containing protein [Flavobacteriales bacterium]
MSRNITLTLAALLVFINFVTGQTIEISSIASHELTVCGSSGQFEVLINNNSGISQNSPEVSISLPPGIEYQPSSLNELTSHSMSELDVSNPSELQFSSGIIANGDSLKFSVSLVAQDASVDYQNSGGVFRNSVVFDANGSQTNHESDSYNILYPALTILSISPNVDNIMSGSSTTRSITVINAGNGPIDRIYITDIRNNDALLLNSVDIGILDGDTIVLSTTDFSGVGNGNNLLDQNESITITEYLSGISCADLTVTSAIRAHWGCDGANRSTTTSYGNISLDFQEPNLKLLATETLDACFGGGVASEQQLRVINTSSGIATGVSVDIYKSTGSNYNQDIYSRFDENSFKYKVGETGTYTSISGLNTTTTQSAGAYSCLGASPIGRVDFQLEELAPGDTVFIKWDMYSCCIQTCEDDDIKGWRAEVAYTDVCAGPSTTKTLVGQDDNEQYISFTTETPIDITDLEEETYTFIISSFKNDLPEGVGASYRATFTLEEGLVYESVRFHTNGNDWIPSSVDYNASTHVVECVFDPPANSFVLPKSELELTLSGACGTQGWKTIELDFAYIPDNTCSTACEIPLECDRQVTTYLHCPTPSCAGLRVLDFTLARTSFGAPDNNLDGNPDNSGSLNMTEVKSNRAMVGDTILATATSVVGPTSDSWLYSKYTSSVNYGSVLNCISATATIYDASSASTFVATGLVASESTSGNQRDFEFDLSISNLSSLNPELIGYSYSEQDSIKVEMLYKVVSNVTGLLQETTFLNDFYLSDFANPTAGQQESCSFKHGRVTLIGYQWRNDSGNNVTIKSCSRNVSQNFGLSIGDLSSNYGGGNLFPFEYRHWGNVKEAWMIIPANYSHVSTQVRQWRTRYTNATSVQTVNGIAPDAINGDTLYFDLQQHYDVGDFNLSDDGFNGRIEVELAPNCNTLINTFEDVEWIFNYQKAAMLDNTTSGQIAASSSDRVRYQPSSFELSSNNPWQDVNTRSVTWNYKVKNSSSSAAAYSWVHIVAPSNIVIDSITNNSNGQALIKQNDLYLIGTINGNSTATLSIHGTVINCNNVLLTAYSGYECTGYPDDFASFTCGYESLVLYVEPKEAAFQTRLSTEVLVDPCAPQVDLTLGITSVKIAHVYDMTIELTVSDSSKIKVLDGTSEFQYNSSSAFTEIENPSFSSGVYSYDVNLYESSFPINGLPGVLDLTNNQYRLKMRLELGPQFVQGDFVQITIQGENGCTETLPIINLAYDPNSKFTKDQTAGLHIDIGNSWSASWGDYDNDGFDDLYVPVSTLNEPNILYHNNGDGTFSKIATGPPVTDIGASITSAWGDYDNDGYLDLFVANNVNSKNRLYHNNGDGTFTSITNNAVVDEGIYTHSAAWGDYNQDGNLDLVISDFHPTHFNRLFYGDGAGGFTVDASSPISLSATSAVGLSWGDYDNDGDLDLFIANTNGENNQLFRNETGIFNEVTTGDIVSDGGNSVGGVWGDYDNDGDLDLFVTNSRDVEANFLYSNNGDATFTRITSGAIVSNLSNSHGASWIDYDNDADLDLLVANNQQQKNYLFANNGDGTFSKLTNAITEEKGDSYGTAWSDFDNDGDYDLFVANINSSANDFFINEKGSCTNHIVVKLNGCNSNSYGVGALIRVKADIDGTPTLQTRHVSTQTSAMGGQNSFKILFGLKDASSVDSVIVQWPSGVLTVIENPAINQILTINEPCGSRICGVVFHDENGNDVQDPGELGIANMNLLVMPGNFQVFTDANGAYQFYVDDGSYTITQTSSPNWTQVYPDGNQGYTLNVNQATQSEYCENDFGNDAVCPDPDLEVSLGATAFRRGFHNDLNVMIANVGAFDANTVIDLELTLSDNLYMTDSTWVSTSTGIGTRIYNYELASLAALSDTVISLTDSVALSGGLDDPVNIAAEVSISGGECALVNNNFTVNDVIVGSVDPNDKLVFVNGTTETKVVSNQDQILYKIRFQNIGNYPAKIVRLVDSLSVDLDWSTFKPLSSSHPFAISVNRGVVTWINSDINLVDSTTNVEASMGYVTFQISPRTGLSPYTLIENDAAIQFDYNDFLITNVTQTWVGSSGISSTIPMVYIYPNPSAGSSVRVMLIDGNNRPLQFERVDISGIKGSKIYSGQVNDYRTELETDSYSPGVYIVSLKTKYGLIVHGKLIISK